jgi:hypothetical protein
LDEDLNCFAFSIHLESRSSRVEPPDLAGILRSTDDIIESMVCPPPPSDPPMISEEMITGLIVPAPGWSKYIEKVVFCRNFLTKLINRTTRSFFQQHLLARTSRLGDIGSAAYRKQSPKTAVSNKQL